MRRSFWARFRAFVAPVHDPRAWFVMAVFALIVWFIDPVMVKTMLAWVLQAPILLGLAAIGSRIIYHQIKLKAHVDGALAGNLADGVVVAGLLVSDGLIILAFAIFARAL